MMMPDPHTNPRANFHRRYDLPSAGAYLFDEAQQLLESRLGARCPASIHKNGRYVLFLGTATEGQLSVDGYAKDGIGSDEEVLITCAAFRLRWNIQDRNGGIEVPRGAQWRRPTLEEVKACADALRQLRPLALALLPTRTRDPFGELTPPRRPSAKRENELDIQIQAHLDKLFTEINPLFRLSA